MDHSPALGDGVHVQFGKEHGLRLKMLNGLYDTAVSLQNSGHPDGKHWHIALRAIRQLADAHQRFLPRIWPSTATLLHKQGKLEHYLGNPEALPVIEQSLSLLRTLQFPEDRIEDACRIAYEVQAEMQQRSAHRGKFVQA
jgi:hypothetical protein